MAKKPKEGHPHTILADAVNQLAMEVQRILVVPAGTVFSNREATEARNRLNIIRETLTPLIPD